MNECECECVIFFSFFVKNIFEILIVNSDSRKTANDIWDMRPNHFVWPTTDIWISYSFQTKTYWNASMGLHLQKKKFTTTHNFSLLQLRHAMTVDAKNVKIAKFLTRFSHFISIVYINMNIYKHRQACSMRIKLQPLAKY